MTAVVFEAVAPWIESNIPGPAQESFRAAMKHGLGLAMLERRDEFAMAVRLRYGLPPTYWETSVPLAEVGHDDAVTEDIDLFAKVLALAVRNAIEDFHVAYTGDDVMPDFNRRVRAAVVSVVLEGTHDWPQATHFVEGCVIRQPQARVTMADLARPCPKPIDNIP